MAKTKVIDGPTAKLSEEAVKLINEIWELMSLVNGQTVTAEELRSEIYIGSEPKDEYQLRKVRLKYHTAWQNKDKKKQPELREEPPYREGGEGQYGDGFGGA